MGDCCCFGCHRNGADNITRRNRFGRGADEKRKRKIAKELQRVCPCFKRTTLESEQGKFPADFVERSSRLSKPGEADVVWFEPESRDCPLTRNGKTPKEE